ncbi:unnamed protein product [Calypogeia fissa]
MGSRDMEPEGHRRRKAVLNSLLLREVMGSDSESEKDDENDKDEPDPLERPKKRVHEHDSNRAQKRAKTNGSGEKVKEGGQKRKRQAKVIAEEADTGREDLIEIIKQKGKAVQHAASSWVEHYETNADEALRELLTTLFQACGVNKSGLDELDWNDIDVDDAVQALVGQAKDIGLEDYLASKQREVRNFQSNLLTFWDSVIRECQDGPLFDQRLMEKIMDYVIALSCTPPRIFRRVATLVGCQLVTSLVGVGQRLGESRETAQRQLNAEKKKRKDGPRVESLNKTLSETHEKITTVEEMMRKLFTGLFMHRYRDVDSEIRMGCISSIGSWILTYPSLFLQDLYLKYIGWTLNDKNPSVRRSSVLALQDLYGVDDNIPSLGLFTERFSNRMIELADDIDVNVAVSAIGLLKQLLRHRLLEDDDMGPLYEFLIDESPQIRHAVGDLVYDHLIAPASGGKDHENLEGQLERLLQILREFSGDPILCDYVIDALWDKCKAMKDWKCMTAMLLDERPSDELTDGDATNLVRVLSASVKKSIGEKIVPTSDHRKASLTKAQKDLLEANKKEMTVAMIKSLTKLLRKYLVDQAKVPGLVDIILHMNLELYSLQRRETSFATALQLIKDAFFKHGDSITLKACVKSLAFAANESHADLQDSAQHLLKETVDDLASKLRSAMELAGEDDDYSLTVNLRRMYHLQSAVNVFNEGLFGEMLNLLEEFSNLDDEVGRLIFLNLFLHIAWSLKAIDPEDPDDSALASLLATRARFIQQLYMAMDSVLDNFEQGYTQNTLNCTICFILSDIWSLFSEKRLANTKLQSLGFCPPENVLRQFWTLCENRLISTDDSDEEVTEGLHAEFLNEKDMVMTAAAKLIAHDMVPKDFLGPEILSHYVLHGKTVAETVKQLLAKVKLQMQSEDLSGLYLNAMKRAYERHLNEVSGSDEDLSRSPSFLSCKDLASRLSSTFLGMARAKYRPSILSIVKGGIEYAFFDAPRQLSFLEGGVIQFALKLPPVDIREILADIVPRVKGIDTDQDPSGWRPFFNFVEILNEKSARQDGNAERQGAAPPRQTRRRMKKKGIQGKTLFEAHDTSSDELEEEHMSESDNNDREDIDDEDDDTPLYQVRQSIKTAKKSNTASRPGPSRQAAPEASTYVSSPSGENAEYEEQVYIPQPTPDYAPQPTPAFTPQQIPDYFPQPTPDYANYEAVMATEEQLPSGNMNWRPSGSRSFDDDEDSKGSSRDDSPTNTSDFAVPRKSRSKAPRPLSSEDTGSV